MERLNLKESVETEITNNNITKNKLAEVIN